jgi:peroxiredoxin
MVGCRIEIPLTFHMKKIILSIALTAVATFTVLAAPETKVKVGEPAPAFTIKAANGEIIDLAKLTENGPALVRLTCGCLGCDKELPYFQALHEAYKDQGLTSIAVFAESDEKFQEYAKTKKLNMLYALDPKRDSWKVFQTRSMPSNFLIEKGGKVIAISKGCDPSGLIARNLGDRAAKLVKVEKVDIKKQVDAAPKPATAKPRKK